MKGNILTQLVECSILSAIIFVITMVFVWIIQR